MATMLTEEPSGKSTAPGRGAARGERLYPWRGSRIYWHLNQLRRAYESIIKLYADSLRNAELVDYGCGNMPYRPLFAPLVAKYIGCDFPGNEMAEEYLDREGGLTLPDSSADVLLSSQVLEHVQDPDFYLTEARRALRDEGTLILSTHGVWSYHPDPTDFWRWTCDGLRLQVERNGFVIKHFEGVMGPEATALQIWQDAVAHRVYPLLRPLFQRCIQWQMERADRRCPPQIRNKDACVYLLLATKSA